MEQTVIARADGLLIFNLIGIGFNFFYSYLMKITYYYYIVLHMYDTFSNLSIHTAILSLRHLHQGG